MYNARWSVGARSHPKMRVDANPMGSHHKGETAFTSSYAPTIIARSACAQRLYEQWLRDESTRRKLMKFV